jgi:hypothetical protein
MLFIIAINIYVFIRIMHAIFVIAARVHSRRSSREDSQNLVQLKKGIKASASFLSLLGSKLNCLQMIVFKKNIGVAAAAVVVVTNVDIDDKKVVGTC